MIDRDENNLLRKVQLLQLEILLEFNRICNKHKIKYQLYAGTLLGAIRHKGFIPWDDDIDVCMLRVDYEKFLSVCKNELKNEYFLQTTISDKKYIMQYAKIRKNETLFIEGLMSDCDIHHGVFIDVFPLDSIKPNTIVGGVQKYLLIILSKLNISRVKKVATSVKNPIKKLFALSAFYFMKIVPKKFFNHIQTKVIKMFYKNNTEFVCHLTNGVSKKRYKLYSRESKDFYNISLHEFEGYMFPVPSDFHGVLTQDFGDYMQLPPEMERQPHHGITTIEL